MSGKREYQLIINGQTVNTFASVEAESGMLVPKEEDDALAWFGSMLKPGEEWKKTLVLSPSEEKPGLYDGEEGPYLVAAYSDGKVYKLKWYVRGEKVHLKEGDILLKDVWVRSMTATSDDDSIQQMDIKTESLG